MGNGYTASGELSAAWRRRAVLSGMAAASGLALLGPGRAMAAFDMETALAPRIVGDPDAPIHMAEYFSLSCGHCADFHLGTFKRLRAEWIDTGRVRFEYRDFPLPGPAIYAHALARAVPVDAYESLLDILLRKQQQWSRADDPVSELAKISKIAGIGKGGFADIIQNRSFLEGIVAIGQEGYRTWSIDSTPSFVVNDKDVIRGNVDYGEFLEVLGRHAA